MAKAETTSFYKEQEDIPLKLKLLQTYIKFLSTVWPSQALNFLIKLFATPRTDDEMIIKRCDNLGVFDHGEKNYINLQGDDLFVYTEGSQDPQVLLVPGWESSAYRFVEIIEELRSEDISFCFFDLPAQGRSGGERNHAVKTAKVIRDLLEQTTSVRTIIAHSFGGGSAYLALNQMNDGGLDHVNSLITISSPTSYRSVIGRFNNFLGVPEKIREPLLDKISEYTGYNFRSYDWNTMPNLEDVQVKMFHDLEDPTIPVEDALRVQNMYDVTITEGKGHSEIMLDRNVIGQIKELISEIE